MSWEAPGYAVEELLGFGASGEVWRARDGDTGDMVALKRLRVGRDVAEHEALRREAALLSAFRHHHVVGLRGVLWTGDGLVLVLDYAPGGSLASLLARAGTLPPAEVGSLVAAIASALAAAHAVGLVHGDISSGNVLIGGSGRPLLADLGTARLLGDRAAPVFGTSGFLDPAVGPGGALSASSDVYGLGALAVLALAGPHATADITRAAAELTDPQPLAALLRRMVDIDPNGRPTASEVAHELAGVVGRDGLMVGQAGQARVSRVALTHAAHQSSGPPTAGRHRGGSQPARRSGRRLAAVLAACLAVLAAAGVGYRWGGGQPVHPPSEVLGTAPTLASGPPVGSASWAAVWSALDARRGAAFAAADATLLGRVYLPGCPELPADLRAVRSLAAAGTYALGVRHETTSVQVEAVDADRATLLVVDRMAGYQVRDSAAHLVQRAPARGERRWRASLVRTASGWLIAGLVAA